MIAPILLSNGYNMISYVHSVQTPLGTFAVGDQFDGNTITDIFIASEGGYFGLGGKIHEKPEQIGIIYSKEAVVTMRYK